MTRLNWASLLAAIAAPVLTLSAAWIPPAGATVAGDHTATPSSPQLVLPHPIGPYPAGRETLHLVDHSRLDPWVPEASGRELMVSMYYPARIDAGPPAAYLSQIEARLLIERDGLADLVPAEMVSRTRTAARAEATPRPGRYPMVVLTPGFTLHRYTLTNLATELASHGYIVAAVDHAYESHGTEFPGGRVLTCVACEVLHRTPDWSISQARARDVSFLIDQLTGDHPAWHYAGLIDRTRIGMAGHSIGGGATEAAMEADQRVRAGVNLDGPLGSLYGFPLRKRDWAGRPFLVVESDDGHSLPDKEGSKDRQAQDYQNMDGWKRWLVIQGTAHIALTDLGVLADQLGIPGWAYEREDWPLPSLRTAQIMREYVVAFFDLHLRGVPQPILDGPTPSNPEVQFYNPPAK
jgi:Platelet-activating factor acetylhydrolase, isoform II